MMLQRPTVMALYKDHIQTIKQTASEISTLFIYKIHVIYSRYIIFKGLVEGNVSSWCKV